MLSALAVVSPCLTIINRIGAFCPWLLAIFTIFRDFKKSFNKKTEHAWYTVQPSCFCLLMANGVMGNVNATVVLQIHWRGLLHIVPSPVPRVVSTLSTFSPLPLPFLFSFSLAPDRTDFVI
jgi:hypothetical protein